MNKQVNFFFYGTLMKYPPRKDRVISTENAEVNGRLFTFNRFPAAVLGGEKIIKGKVISYNISEYDLSRMIGDIDAWEGCRDNNPANSVYLRKQVKAKTSSEEEVECTMYVFNREVESEFILSLLKREEIPNGDWLEWRRNQR